MILLGEFSKLKDPKGGLTAAGREHFNAKSDGNLKPGVHTKGKVMSPEDMRRKGSFLRRFYSNPKGAFIKLDGSLRIDKMQPN